ncbi:hypothetical protein [Trueperella abortisuis]|uniref:Uncharacterized protein n=1 Tax=Trueperella abortisuis TaxID=445930 RepID=A0ABT9PJ09_9ACTO|nr:hypothetical protein [Trueperella abortisuis]MDP9832668.1 hypothetical protein [Trueperella abortisuis]
MTLNDRFPLGPFLDQEISTIDDYIEELYQLFLSDLVQQPLPWKNEGLHVSLLRAWKMKRCGDDREARW